MRDFSTPPPEVSRSEVEDSQCLIKPGEYEVTYLFYNTSTCFGRPNITVWFRVVSPGEVFGLYLPRHYNMEWIKKGGGFKARRHSAFVRDFIAVTGERVNRTDRIPMEDRYKGRMITALVKTVSRDSKGKKLHELARYSVIEQLLRSNTQ